MEVEGLQRKEIKQRSGKEDAEDREMDQEINKFSGGNTGIEKATIRRSSRTERPTF